MTINSVRCRATCFLLLASVLVSCRADESMVTEPEPIARQLQDSDPEIRVRALQELAGVQMLPPDAVEGVVKLLQDDIRVIRFWAAEVLNCAGPSAKPQIDAIQAALEKENDQEIRSKLRDALFRLQHFP